MRLKIKCSYVLRIKKKQLYAKEMFLLFPKQGSNCSSFQSFKNLKACSVTCQRLKLLPLYADTQLVIRMIQQWPPKSKSTPPKCTVRLNARDDGMTDFSLYKKYVYVHGLSLQCTICGGVHDTFLFKCRIFATLFWQNASCSPISHGLMTQSV